MSWAENTKLRLRFFCIALLFMGPGFLIWLAPKLLEEYRSNSWPAVDGEIVGHVAKPTGKKDGNRSTYIGRAQYRYVVDGQTHTSDMTNFVNGPPRPDVGEALADVSRYPVGESVTVYYDPAAPGTAVLENGTPINHSGVAVGMAIGTIVGAVVTTRTVRTWLHARRATRAETKAPPPTIA